MGLIDRGGGYLLNMAGSERRGEEVATSIGTMWIEDGLLWHRLATQETITEDDAVSVIEAVRLLSGGEPIPVIVDMSTIGFATAAARNRFAGDIDESLELATALIVRDGPGRLMASAWLKISRPERPVAVFVDQRRAVEWLQQFKKSP